MSFDWDLLQSFLAVARAGKLTVAARQLQLDHSTLSRRLTTLERELLTKLFDRGASGYALTPHGEQLLRRAEEIESRVFGIQSELTNKSSKVSGIVRIGAPDGFGTMFLAPRLGRLTELHPDLEIQLIATPRSFSLSKREADIAIGLSLPEQGRLHARQLTDYELGVYASEDRKDLWASIKAPQDLCRHAFVSYIDDLIFTPELDYVPLISKDIVPKFKSSNLNAQVQAVAAGAGFGILPCFIADADPRLIRILSDEVSLIRTFWMIVHSDTRELARVRVTSDFIASEVRAASQLFV
ncbi:MAG TPA: LysR family transcriptional regulator, partial [Beijerinckia sp.]|nr:LysR family transcriptional regulator [Beijerinckia sp.]